MNSYTHFHMMISSEKKLKFSSTLYSKQVTENHTKWESILKKKERPNIELFLSEEKKKNSMHICTCVQNKFTTLPKIQLTILSHVSSLPFTIQLVHMHEIKSSLSYIKVFITHDSCFKYHDSWLHLTAELVNMHERQSFVTNAYYIYPSPSLRGSSSDNM